MKKKYNRIGIFLAVTVSGDLSLEKPSLLKKIVDILSTFFNIGISMAGDDLQRRYFIEEDAYEAQTI